MKHKLMILLTEVHLISDFPTVPLLHLINTAQALKS